MQYTLAGFTEELGSRVFAFEGVAEDRSRSKFTVRTDLALSRKYGIRLQELPLLCRGLLERANETEETRTLIFTEDQMFLHAKGAQAAAAQKKKPARRPQVENLGAAWRAAQPR